MKYLFRLLLCLLLLGVLPAFADTGNSPVAVIVTPPEVLLKAGQTVQLQSYAYFQDGTITNVTNSGSTWSTLDKTIATVSSTGLVTMVKGGSVLIENKVGIIDGYGTIVSAYTKFLSVPPGSGSAGKIDHIVLIVKENRSFDNYFGTY